MIFEVAKLIFVSLTCHLMRLQKYEQACSTFGMFRTVRIVYLEGIEGKREGCCYARRKVRVTSLVLFMVHVLLRERSRLELTELESHEWTRFTPVADQ